MASNFDFLKTVDKKLFDLIETAEQLYRDEYFDQCIVQTRKFAENICKLSYNNKDENRHYGYGYVMRPINRKDNVRWKKRF